MPMLTSGHEETEADLKAHAAKAAARFYPLRDPGRGRDRVRDRVYFCVEVWRRTNT